MVLWRHWPAVVEQLRPACSRMRTFLWLSIVKFTDYIFSRNFWIYRSTCLRRSLVLYHFLRKAGIDVQICFGVRYEEKSPNRDATKTFEGHAWLLYKGEIFLERNDDIVKAYTVTYRFPEQERLKQQAGTLT